MPQPKTMKAGSPDNFQTDPAALDYLVRYIPKWRTIWEPACGNGNLITGFIERGYKNIIASDVKGGHDFMSWRPEQDFNCIVTNPPFSMKEQFMGRCYQLGKPWALLMPITTFDSNKRRQLMASRGIEIILPTRRIKFETPNHDKRIKEGKKPGSAWFYSAWFTWGLNLGKQLTFCDNVTLKV